ncbi:serine/threonine-protein kinase/endoribonuclease IRE1a-like protein [Tanacetum coccineum]
MIVGIPTPCKHITGNECLMYSVRAIPVSLYSSPPIVSKRRCEVLVNPWLWDTHTVIQFITTYSRGDTGFAPRHRGKGNLGSSYDFGKGCSLVRIVHNAFNHHDEMDKDVREKVGITKEEMLGYFGGKFPQLVMTLYATRK